MAKDRQTKPVRKPLPRKGVVVIEASAASVFGPAAAGVQRLLGGLGKLRAMRAPRDEIAGVLLVVLGMLGLLSLPASERAAGCACWHKRCACGWGRERYCCRPRLWEWGQR